MILQTFEKFNMTFDHKTVMELCNKISQTSVVKIISEKQIFFIVKLVLKHDYSLLKIHSLTIH